MNATNLEIKVADEVFVATALLHKENQRREDFTIGEIVERVKKENLFGELRPGVRVHVSVQCVANRPPNPGKYAMLWETANSRRRLVLEGDHFHPARTGKVFPDPGDLPPKYRDLVEWAKKRYAKGGGRSVQWLGGILQMAGMGKGIWKDEDPDQYVRRLREGWK